MAQKVRSLSKSKLIAFRQCPKRLWLEIHKPELRDDSGSEARFKVGHEVGELAQKLFDRDGRGELINPHEMGWTEAYARSTELLKTGDVPIFESTMRISGAMAMADVMLPDRSYKKLQWEMIEVKSSTSVKDYHSDDAAIQAYIAKRNGVRLSLVGVAHIDNQFIYRGNRDYEGLLRVEDLTKEVKGREDEVEDWIAAAQKTAAKRKEPVINTGPHCTDPFDCGFRAYCSRDALEPEHPASLLPYIRGSRLEDWADQGITELHETPDAELNAQQLKVKKATLRNKTFFDRSGAREALANHKMPAYFLDFETVTFAIPIWVGTRPYEQLPFQFSLHRVSGKGHLSHAEFLDISGSDPRKALAKKLIESCGKRGPVYVYNASFEKMVLSKLAAVFPKLSVDLDSIRDRIEDLLPVARDHYYHPRQRGSWGLKAVLPAICPELSHEDLEVQQGLEAVEAFKEAITPATSVERKEEIRGQLLEYCQLDTLATVRIWEFFRGRNNRH